MTFVVKKGNDMKISIILPVYNGARYLSEALESVRCQTHEDFECLCIDDGSVDESADIISDFVRKDTRFKLITQSNAGVAVARNKGLSMAAGAAITFLDQDDLLVPNALEVMLDAMFRTGCGVVSAQIAEFNNDKVPIPKFQTGGGVVNVSKTPFDDFFGIGKPECVRVAVWGKLYKKEAIKRICFPNGIFGADDYVFTVRLYSSISSYADVDAKIYLYRMHPENVTTQMPMRYIMDTLKAREIAWHEALENSNISAKYRAKVFRRYSKKIMFWAIAKSCSGRYTEEEMFALRKEVWRLWRGGVISRIGLRDKLKCLFFCTGCKSLLKTCCSSMFQ